MNRFWRVIGFMGVWSFLLGALGVGLGIGVGTLWAPDSRFGPLLAFYITGPAGLFTGLVVGFGMGIWDRPGR